MSKLALSFASRVVAALVLGFGLAACATSRNISGVVTIQAPSDVSTADQMSASGMARLPAESVASVIPRHSFDSSSAPKFVPGEAIVMFHPGLSVQSLSTLRVDDVALEPVRPLALNATMLYRASGLDEAATLQLIEKLQARPDVISAAPNYILRALETPSDPYYGYQWHYEAIELPAAWGVSTGSSDTVVAVLDSGILFDPTDPSRTHPDLIGKVVAGYDFISSLTSAADGDGRDPDPYDPGGDSTYHGTHVAGTIAAATNNLVGVAGVDWSASILPVRVLGTNGTGTTADVLDGAMWAAGLGELPNPNPADVLNVSLGAAGVQCYSTYQAYFDQILAAGKVVVVAAGNKDWDASDTFPANCNGVITVGATDGAGRRASYSNYGVPIDVMAPGGDASGGYVLSLGKNDETGQFGYYYAAGTSMAAPHVAGLAALIKSVDPLLTPEEIETILKGTARPLTNSACQGNGTASGAVPASDDCGAGLVDAYAALLALNAYVEACYAGDCEDARSVGLSIALSGGSAFYTIPGLVDGQYAVRAWRDHNHNDVIDAGDYYGEYDGLVRPPIGNVDIELIPQ